MLKTIKDIRVFGAILIVVMMAFLFASYLVSDDHENENYIKVGAYFLNPATNTLEREEHLILKASDEEMIAELLLNILFKGPGNKLLVKAIPEYVTFQRGELVENKSLLQLEFNTGGEAMTGEEELYFKSSLVWTMTELPMITDLHVYVNEREMLRTDGEPVGLMNRKNVIINTPISPFVNDVYRILLYFANEQRTGLLPEERVIEVSRSGQNQYIEKYVVEHLIAGPSQPEHFATVPPETKIREVGTEGDTCYVNLSSDFITRSGDDAGLMIYSIVNSLTELDNIKKVQFLVDSKRTDLAKGGYDLSTPIERDESFILVGDNN